MTQTGSRPPASSHALPPPTDRFYGQRPPGTEAEVGGILRRTLTLAEPPVHRGFSSLRRRRYLVLGAWSAAWFIVFALRGGYSWHYFVQGSDLLFHGAAPATPTGGLHLYAHYPQLQIGPFTFVVAYALRLFGSYNGLLAAELAMTAMGAVTLYCVEQAVLAIRPRLEHEHPGALDRTLLIGGAAFMVGWEDLAVAYGHLDDALALLLLALATRALLAQLPGVAGICLGLSVDAKPWALIFLPLILAAPARARRYTGLWAAITVLLAWLPFVLADPGTLTATQFGIMNVPSSALRALGVGSPTTPDWDRAAQILLGCALGSLAVRRRRWPALILLGVGARIALDPGVYGYYTAGALLGALIWDLLGPHRPAPTWTLLCGASLAIAPVLTSDNALLGQLRLWLVLAFTVALLLLPARQYGPIAPGQAPAT